jgi:rSAM/selenodomain-associated transferase 2
MRPLIKKETIPDRTRKTPWCSVIIPVLNEAAILKQQVQTVMDALPAAGVEVILVDGGSEDDSRRIAQELGCRVIDSPRGRALQMNTGAANAQGTLLYFLHLDTTPPTEWVDILQQAKEDNSLPLTFRLKFSGQERSPLLRFFSWCSQFDIDAFRFGDQSLLVHRDDFRAIGGFREDHSVMEGHDIIRRLRRHTGRLTVHPAGVTTSPRRYLKHGTIFTQMVFALIFLMYKLGLPQQRLVAVYDWAFKK